MAKKSAGRNSKKQPTRISGAHKLLASSFRLIYGKLRLFGGVVLVAVAINLIIRLSGSAEVTTFYQSLWLMLVSMSLIWVARHASSNPKPTLAKALYIGTGPLVKFFLVLLVLVLASLPFSLGAFVYSTIIFVGGSGFWEETIAVMSWLALGTISLWLLSRLLFALIIVTLPEVRPVAAIRLSWQLSKGRVGALVGRLLIFFIYATLLILVLTLGLSLVQLNQQILQVLIEVVSLGIILPMFYVYLFQMYKELA